MAKHVLNILPSSFDFLLLGITCGDNQYRVLSLLNDALEVEFTLSHYVPLNVENSVFSFSLYKYSDEDLRLEYFLIPNLSNYHPENKNPEGNLFTGTQMDTRTRIVKELPKTDYFLMIKGEEMAGLDEKIKERLKKVREFQNVHIIQPEDLPSRSNLIF